MESLAAGQVVSLAPGHLTGRRGQNLENGIEALVCPEKKLLVELTTELRTDHIHPMCASWLFCPDRAQDPAHFGDMALDSFAISEKAATGATTYE